jgi:hypothetical protein
MYGIYGTIEWRFKLETAAFDYKLLILSQLNKAAWEYAQLPTVSGRIRRQCSSPKAQKPILKQIFNYENLISQLKCFMLL